MRKHPCKNVLCAIFCIEKCMKYVSIWSYKIEMCESWRRSLTCEFKPSAEEAFLYNILKIINLFSLKISSCDISINYIHVIWTVLICVIDIWSKYMSRLFIYNSYDLNIYVVLLLWRFRYFVCVWISVEIL